MSKNLFVFKFDLAELYQVETKRLKEAVRRNSKRFDGEDFMFELRIDEYNLLVTSLRTQFATSNLTFQNEISNEQGGRRYMPFAFTEIGVAMLSSVLRSETAILVNRGIMRAFVAIRGYIAITSTVTSELAEIRAKLALLERSDEDAMNMYENISKEIEAIYNAIASLSIKAT
jgi:ORF6N domain.